MIVLPPRIFSLRIAQTMALECLREAVTDSYNLRLPISCSAPAFPNVRPRHVYLAHILPAASDGASVFLRPSTLPPKGLNLASYPRHSCTYSHTGGLRLGPAGAGCGDAPLWGTTAFSAGIAPAGDRVSDRAGPAGAIGDRRDGTTKGTRGWCGLGPPQG